MRTSCLRVAPVLFTFRARRNPAGAKRKQDKQAREIPRRPQPFNAIGKIAEAEGHHPDLHLTGYRNVAVELSTHAVSGLTENDFILAAKIDKLPVELKK